MKNMKKALLLMIGMAFSLVQSEGTQGEGPVDRTQDLSGFSKFPQFDEDWLSEQSYAQNPEIWFPSAFRAINSARTEKAVGDLVDTLNEAQEEVKTIEKQAPNLSRPLKIDIEDTAGQVAGLIDVASKIVSGKAGTKDYVLFLLGMVKAVAPAVNYLKEKNQERIDRKNRKKMDAQNQNSTDSNQLSPQG